MQESEENFIKHFICSFLPAVSMGTSGCNQGSHRSFLNPETLMTLVGVPRGGLERTFVGLWMSLAGPHFCLEGSGFKSILLRCSEIFVHEGASASSVPHLTFWKFLSPSFSTQTYLRKIKSNQRSQAWWYTPVFPALGKQGRRIPSSRIARVT